MVGAIDMIDMNLHCLLCGCFFMSYYHSMSEHRHYLSVCVLILVTHGLIHDSLSVLNFKSETFHAF